MIFLNNAIRFSLFLSICSVFICSVIIDESVIAQTRDSQPVVITTKDGQQVIFDVATFIGWKTFQDTPFTANWPDSVMRKKMTDEWFAKKLIPIQEFPFKIIDDIYALEYGYPKHDAQRIYLVDCGEGLLLIDPSYVEFQPMVEENIKKLGFQSSQVKWVLNTHYHFDHAASCAYWRTKGAKIIINKFDAQAGKPEGSAAAYYIKSMNIPGLKYSVPPAQVDRLLVDGEQLVLGNKTFLTIHTPGHSPGSSCFLLKHAGKNILFSGDVILYHGRFAAMGIPDANWDTYLNSIYKLKDFHYNNEKVSFDLLLPGHGAIALSDANLDIERTGEIVADIMKEPDLKKRNAHSVSPFQFYWEKEKAKHSLK